MGGDVCLLSFILFLFAQSMGLCFIGKRDFTQFISEVKVRYIIFHYSHFHITAVPGQEAREVCVSLWRRTRPPRR